MKNVDEPSDLESSWSQRCDVMGGDRVEGIQRSWVVPPSPDVREQKTALHHPQISNTQAATSHCDGNGRNVIEKSLRVHCVFSCLYNQRRPILSKQASGMSGAHVLGAGWSQHREINLTFSFPTRSTTYNCI